MLVVHHGAHGIWGQATESLLTGIAQGSVVIWNLQVFGERGSRLLVIFLLSCS